MSMTIDMLEEQMREALAYGLTREDYEAALERIYGPSHVDLSTLSEEYAVVDTEAGTVIPVTRAVVTWPPSFDGVTAKDVASYAEAHGLPVYGAVTDSQAVPGLNARVVLWKAENA